MVCVYITNQNHARYSCARLMRTRKGLLVGQGGMQKHAREKCGWQADIPPQRAMRCDGIDRVQRERMREGTELNSRNSAGLYRARRAR